MLSGDLTDFSLRDLLRLLAGTGKSGQLTLHGPGGAGGVFLRDGGICLALIDLTRVPLGPRLIRAGHADRDAVATAARAADGTAFGIACALLRGVDDSEAAATVVADHTREAIGWLLQYFAATFEFDPTVAVDGWPFDPLTAEQVLGDVERAAHQWADLGDVVADLSLVPGCVPDVEDTASVDLTDHQWRLVALIDGQRTVREVVEAAGVGHLEAGRELAHLVGRGLVELLQPGVTSAVDALRADILTVDTFAVSPTWMARDDDVPARTVIAAPAGHRDDAGDAVMAATAEPPPAGPALQALQAAPPESVAPPVPPVPAGPETGGVPSPAESTPDANVGLLNRLVGRGRSS